MVECDWRSEMTVNKLASVICLPVTRTEIGVRCVIEVENIGDKWI